MNEQRPATTESGTRAALNAGLADRYRLEESIGQGGMATVYRARDLRHDRDVAIKVLQPELAASIGGERFLREIRLTAKLNHPHVLPLYDSGESAGVLFYVMPLVSGGSLAARMARESPLPIDEAIRVVRDVADALGHAHAHDLVHRDIKPENVLLSEGHALVADFGISRAVSAAGGEQLTQAGVAIGTPAYMSPEQAAGDPALDARTDVYALGCVLYETLVGQIPFPAPTVQGMMARHTVEQVSPPSVLRPATPAWLEAVVLRAMAKNPVDRFATGAEFAAALDQKAATTSPTPKPTVPLAATTAVKRRSPLAAVAILAGLVAGLAVAFAATRGGEPAAPTAAVATGVMSVGVLPFDDVSPDSASEYFAIGLTDEVVDVLSRIDGLRVAGRTSTRAVRQLQDVTAIGNALNVDAVFDGSVRKAGERVLIIARLVDASSGQQLWSGRYERTIDDVFAVQEEIALSMAAAVRGELSASEEPLGSSLTSDPMAHDKYLWGQFNLSRETEDGAVAAIDNFTMSIGFDSAFSNAYAGRAEARLALADYNPTVTPGLPGARDDAETAIRLGANLARPRTALGLVKYRVGDWVGAEAEYVAALEISPDDPLVRRRYAQLLTTVGRVDDALVHARVAVAGDPLSIPAHRTLLHALRAAGRFGDAIGAGQAILRLNENDLEAWLDLGVLFLAEGRFDDAQDALGRYGELRVAEAGALSSVVESARRFGETGTVGRIAATISDLLAHDPVQLAVVHHLVGDTGGAISVLEAAHRNDHPAIVNLTARPELGALRDAPRFRAIVAARRL